jgi:hypothetical protein
MYVLVLVQMRLPSLLASQGLLLAANLLRFYGISRFTGLVWLWRTLSQRLLVLMIGLAFDLRRRHFFLWQCSKGVVQPGSTSPHVKIAGPGKFVISGSGKMKVQ